MTIDTLHQGDLAELLVFLNKSFGHDPDSHFFEKKLPKMWFDDEEHLEKHLVIRENGKMIATVGVYPFPVTISGKTFTFATVGNMGTAEEARGKGCMTALYERANRVLEEKGIAVARLGGLRSRYDRFGYEPCGNLYRFILTHRNATDYLKNHPTPAFVFKAVGINDQKELSAIRRLYNGNGIATDRGDDRDLYHTLNINESIPHVAYLDQKIIGYFTLRKNRICESAADSPDLLAGMLCRFNAEYGQELSVYLPPDHPGNLKALADFCEDQCTDLPSQYKILDWAPLTDALLQLKKERIAPLTDGKFHLEIQGYGTLTVTVEQGVGHCEKTEHQPDLSLSTQEASRLLFGPLPPYAAAELPPEKATFITANFPLPFYTFFHDKS